MIVRVAPGAMGSAMVVSNDNPAVPVPVKTPLIPDDRLLLTERKFCSMPT